MNQQGGGWVQNAQMPTSTRKQHPILEKGKKEFRKHPKKKTKNGALVLQLEVS